MSLPSIEVYVWDTVPEYKSALAAGADLRAYVHEPVLIKPWARMLISTNTYIALPQGYEAQVRARSGLSLKHGIALINGIGTIDADYRGEICLPLINMSDVPYTLERGVRIAQLVIARCERVVFIPTKTFAGLPTCDKVRKRYTKGFGSTGTV